MLRKILSFGLMAGAFFTTAMEATPPKPSYQLCATPRGALGNEISNYFTSLDNDPALSCYRLKYQVPRCNLTTSFVAHQPAQYYVHALQSALQSQTGQFTRSAIVGFSVGAHQGLDQIAIGCPYFYKIAQQFCKNAKLASIALINPQATPYSIPLCHVVYQPSSAHPSQDKKFTNRVKVLKFGKGIDRTASQEWSVTLYEVTPGGLKIVTDIPL